MSIYNISMARLQTISFILTKRNQLIGNRLFPNSIVSNRQINITGNRPIRRNESSKSRNPYGYLFIALPVATFCLGTWQIFRRRWKLDLIDKLENIIKNDPIDLAECLADIEDREYTKVKVRGFIDQNSSPMFIYPRSLIVQKKSANEREAGGGLISMGNASNVGAQLVIPFVVTDQATRDAIKNKFGNEIGSNDRILINLGWIPANDMKKVNNYLNDLPENSHNDQRAKQSTEIELVGVIRKTEKREPFREKKEVINNYWTRRDIDKMSQKQSTLPILLEAVESYPIRLVTDKLDLTPIGSQTRVNLRNEHLSYIITWYSLTAIFSYLWFTKIFKPRL